MQRTYRVPLARVGLVGLAAIAFLLTHPGASIAGDPSMSNRAAADPDTALQRGAGYLAVGQRPQRAGIAANAPRLGWRPGRVDGLFGPQTEAAVERLRMPRDSRSTGSSVRTPDGHSGRFADTGWRGVPDTPPAAGRSASVACS